MIICCGIKIIKAKHVQTPFPIRLWMSSDFYLFAQLYSRIVEKYFIILAWRSGRYLVCGGGDDDVVWIL